MTYFVILMTLEIQHRYYLVPVFRGVQYILFFTEPFYQFSRRTGHLDAEIAVPFTRTELSHPVGKIFFVFYSLTFCQHFAHSIRLFLIVAVFVNNFADFKSRRFWTGNLTFGWIAKAHHTAGHNMRRQIEHLLMHFKTFDDIAYIAASYTKAFCGNNSILA